MTKYIDADLLKKDIKRLEKAAHKSALGCADSETRKFHEGKDFAYQHVGILIDSLQQEQLVDGLEEEIEKYFQGWFNDDEYGDAVTPDYTGVSVDECKDIARHFAELGASHAVAPHYFKLREIKTGRVFFAEWSDIAGEWYERGNGKAHQSDEVEIVQHLKK